MNHELLDKLKRQGWQVGSGGSLTHPTRSRTLLGPLETRGTEPAPACPLDARPAERPGGLRCVVLRVSMVAFRRRLLDPDAVAYAAKPLTDAVARWLGIDDADPRVEWSWQQLQTRGAEGVLVKLEEVQ